MCSKQFGFDFNEMNQHDKIAWLFTIVNKKLADTLDSYSMTNEQIVYIQLAFMMLNVKLLADFALDENSSVSKTMATKEIDTITTTSNIPVSTSETSLGSSLRVEFINNLITHIHVTIKNESFNFLDRIMSQSKFLMIGKGKSTKHNDNITSFDSSFKFYFIYINSSHYVLATKYIDNNKVLKISYLLNGVVDNVITDTLLSDNIVSRVNGNTEYLIENNNVIHSKQSLMIRPISKPNITLISREDFNIGVIDLETFKDTDDITKVYAAGFRTNLAK